MKSRHLLIGAFALVFCLVVGRAVWSVRAFGEVLTGLERQSLLQQRTEEAIARFNTIAIDLETGIRGFSLTGSQRFLEPYEWAHRQRVEAARALEQHLRTEDARSLARAANNELDAWLGALAEPVINGEVARMSEAQRQALHLEGKERMDRVRDRLRELRTRVTADRDVRAHAIVSLREHMVREAWIIGGLIAGMLSLIAFGVIALLDWPLADLVKRMRQLQKDGRAEPFDLPSRGAREVRELASSLHDMLATLRVNHLRDQRFAELMAMLSQGGSVEALSELALQALVGEQGALGGVLWLGEPGEPLQCTATVGLAPPPPGARSAAERVHRSGQQLFIPALPKQSAYILRTGLLEAVPKALLVAPISAGARIIGVVELAGDIDAAHAGPELQRTLPRIGLALQNALATKRLDELRNTLAELNTELQAQNEALRRQEEVLRAQSEELKTRQRELHKRNEELARASRHKTDFLSNASHELRTPLNAVLGFSELLLQGSLGELDPRQQSAVDDIARAGRHLLDLVNDLLDLSKIEAGRMQLDTGVTDPAACAETACTLVAESAARRGVELRNELVAGELSVIADSRRLHQVLVNLLSNAVRFSPRGGRVTVRATNAGPIVRIEVEDSGPGIAEKDMDRLFQPFEQLSGSAGSDGTGLGLAISRRLVELMGGEVGVTSAEGVGSTFFLTLPRAKDHAAPAPGGGPEHFTSIRARTPLVLVVEDSETDARALESALKAHQFQVRIARSAERALELLHDSTPDALVVDLGLPGMSGRTLIERVRATTPKERLPIVVMSSRSFIPSEVRELETLANSVVEKGMMPTTALADDIARLCRGHRPRPRVLIIDDSDLNRKVMEALLGTAGYDVELAADAEIGLEAAFSSPPALILMDVRLPGIGGLEATRRLRADARTRDVPVIVVSAQAMPGDRERALEAGCAGYVTKPIARRDLFDAIDRAMTGSALSIATLASLSS